MSLIICTVCNWQHFEVSREEAEKNVAAFNAYFFDLGDEVKECFGGPSDIADYECCHKCGSRGTFRKVGAHDKVLPPGCTIGGAIRA